MKPDVFPWNPDNLDPDDCIDDSDNPDEPECETLLEVFLYYPECVEGSEARKMYKKRMGKSQWRR